MKKRGKGLYTNLHDHQAMMDFLQQLYGVKDDNNSKDEDSSTTGAGRTKGVGSVVEHACETKEPILQDSQ
jgi:hypothetical protein